MAPGHRGFFRWWLGLSPEQGTPEQRIQGLEGPGHGGAGRSISEEGSRCKGLEAGRLRVLEEEPESREAGMEGMRGQGWERIGGTCRNGAGPCRCWEGWGPLPPRPGEVTTTFTQGRQGLLCASGAHSPCSWEYRADLRVGRGKAAGGLGGLDRHPPPRRELLTGVRAGPGEGQAGRRV